MQVTENSKDDQINDYSERIQPCKMEFQTEEKSPAIASRIFVCQIEPKKTLLK